MHPTYSKSFTGENYMEKECFKVYKKGGIKTGFLVMSIQANLDQPPFSNQSLAQYLDLYRSSVNNGF